ncbi:MAG: hypothetical protein J6A07_02665, partial [Firmicutes bacterium]|nr:hypothetical protein [Bacillota bacterium]
TTFKNVLYYNPAGHAHDCVQGIKPLCGSQSAQVNAQSPKTFVVYYNINQKAALFLRVLPFHFNIAHKS